MAESNTQPGNALTAPVQTGEPSTALAAPTSRTVRLLRPVVEPALLLEAQNEVREIVKKLMKEGTDYGKVPGVERATLLKPGAEKVNAAYGLIPRFTIIEREADHDRVVTWKKVKKHWKTNPVSQKRYVEREEEAMGTSLGLYRYVIRCDLVDGDGVVRGSGDGACSTLESKYIDRPRDCENTVLKMGEKRAYIAATLLTHGLSEQFTQDVEEIGSAGDDTGGGSQQAPAEDVHDDTPEVGSAEWATAFAIHPNVAKSLKLEKATVGECTPAELQTIIDGCDRVLAKKPNSADTKVLRRAAERQQDTLEDAALLGGAPVVPSPVTTAPDPVTASPSAVADAVADKQRDAGAPPPRAADGEEITDKLPF